MPSPHVWSFQGIIEWFPAMVSGRMWKGVSDDGFGGKRINLKMVKVSLTEICRGRPPRGFDLEPYPQSEVEASTF